MSPIRKASLPIGDMYLGYVSPFMPYPGYVSP